MLRCSSPQQGIGETRTLWRGAAGRFLLGRVERREWGSGGALAIWRDEKKMGALASGLLLKLQKDPSLVGSNTGGELSLRRQGESVWRIQSTGACCCQFLFGFESELAVKQ